jgi:hypothetical protein
MTIERFNWAAERNVMGAPAYFRQMAAQADGLALRGLPVEERIGVLLARRERISRTAGRHHASAGTASAGPARRQLEPAADEAGGMMDRAAQAMDRERLPHLLNGQRVNPAARLPDATAVLARCADCRW